MSHKLWWIGSFLLLSLGCRQDMYDQARYDPYTESKLFADHRSARPTVPGTIARGRLQEDELFHTGLESGKPATRFPFPVTRNVLSRGRERFDIFCAECHDRLGTGRGMIVQRGLSAPSSFHIDRLRDSPPGYYFQVITNGYGRMYSYSSRLPAEDRWAVIAYIRALQRSQHASLVDVPADHKAALK